MTPPTTTTKRKPVSDADFRRVVRQRILTLEERAQKYGAKAKSAHEEAQALRRTSTPSSAQTPTRTRGPNRNGRVPAAKADALVLDFLRTHKPARLSEVKRAIGLAYSSTSTALDRLVEARSVRKRVDGRFEYVPTRIHPGE